MKNRNHILSATLFILFASSCVKEVIIDVPPYTPKLVINSFNTANEYITAQIGKSISVIDNKNNPDLNISNATVTLYENGIPVDLMSYSPTETRYKSTTKAIPGKQYKMKVSAAGFADADAVETTPYAIGINKIEHYKNVRLNEDGQQQDEIRVTFYDPPTMGDYYVLQILPSSDMFHPGNYEFCVNTADPSVETISSTEIDPNTCVQSTGIFLRDALFNGTQKELRFFTDAENILPGVSGTGEMVYASVTLLHVSEAFFRFQKSYRLSKDVKGNPFAEPVNVFTNVNNGYGIFSVINGDIKEIK